ncbi:MAG: autotransporter-associated beta strand repeat-containing protein, partial [Planctomycetia bacterium]
MLNRLVAPPLFSHLGVLPCRTRNRLILTPPPHSRFHKKERLRASPSISKPGRFGVETLEDRTTPATLLWLGTASSNWNSDSWTIVNDGTADPGLRPGNNDVLMFNTTSTGFNTSNGFSNSNNLPTNPTGLTLQINDASGLGDFFISGNQINLAVAGIASCVVSNGTDVNIFADLNITAATTINTTAALDADFRGAGTVVKEGSGTLVENDSSLFTGGFVVNAGGLTVQGDLSANTFTLADAPGVALNMSFATIGNLSGGGASGGTVTLGSSNIIRQTTDATFSGTMTGTNGFTKQGSAVLTLAGAATYTNTTTIQEGILRAGAANVFSSASTIDLANGVGVALDLNNFNNTVQSLTGGGANGGNVTLGSGTLTISNLGGQTYSGVISGAGGLVKNGASTQTFARSNTFTGPVQLNAGSLRGTATGTPFGVGTAVTIANASGAVLDVSGAISVAIGSLAGGGAIGGTLFTSSGSTFTVGNATDTTYSGTVSVGGTFVKVGSSELTFDGTSGSFGATTINAGRILIGSPDVDSLGELTLANVAGAELDLQ